MTPEADAAGRAPADRWPASLVVGFVAALAAGIVIRVVLLPTEGLRGDLDQFVLWVHGIAVDGLPNAYDQNLSFPPVMAYIWGAAGGRPAGLPDRHRRLRPGDPGADEDAGVGRRHRARAARGVRAARPAAVGGHRRGGDPAAPGRHRHQRLVGPVRVDLHAVRAGGGRLRRQRPERAGRRAPGGRADDQAPGAAVPRPVRGLVLGDRRAGEGSCGRRRSAWP